jgi:RNA polymerase sigma-70 factor (ECF subfamily)
MKYLRARAAFESEEHRKAWLLRVTINASKNLLTSAWFRNTAKFDFDVAAPSDQEDGVYWAVAELPPKYRTVVHLYYYEDMSIEEIAETVAGKTSTVASQLHRARQMLREKLKGAI